MTEQEKISHKILRFLNSDARRDINITDETLKTQFYDIDNNNYTASINALILTKAIDRTSPNKQWQITEIGERELNRLQTTLDLEKNIEASANLVKVANTNKWATTILAISTLLVSILTFIAIAFQAYYAKKQTKILEEQTQLLRQEQERKATLLDNKSKLPDTRQVNPLPQNK